MAKLPVTVTAVDYAGRDSYNVTVAFADGTVGNYVIPASLATIEGVTISAVALATLTDPIRPPSSGHHRGHRRYDPRTAT